MSGEHYMCPVCGFWDLKEPSYDRHGTPSHEICPCCGFEFGFDGGNDEAVFAGFRRQWIKNGGCWFMPKLRPKDWHLKDQLLNLNNKR